MSETPEPSRLISTRTEDSLVVRSMRAVRAADGVAPVSLIGTSLYTEDGLGLLTSLGGL